MYKIVYDMDDVLWPFNDRVFGRTKLSMYYDDFHVQNNRHFSATEQAKIMEKFTDPKSFEEIEFYVGARDILRPVELGAKVSIRSNSYNADIRAHKLRQLKEFYPELAEEDFHLELVKDGTGEHLRKKRVGSDVLIFVDDSPYNVANSSARINIMPRKSWNTNISARQIASNGNTRVQFVEDWRSALPKIATRRSKQIVYADGLAEITELAYRIIKYLKEEENGKS